MAHGIRPHSTGRKLNGDLDCRFGAFVRSIESLTRPSEVIDRLVVSCRCDTVPEQHLGRQFGIVSVGDNIGSLVGPPVAGILYQRWGFKAPFVFGIIITAVDLVARLLLIERHEAMRWGVDPMAVVVNDNERDTEVESRVTTLREANKLSAPESRPVAQELSDGSPNCGGEGPLTDFEIEEEVGEGDRREEQLQEPKQPRVTSLPHIVLLNLAKSPRARVSITLSLIWGLVLTAQETTVVLHMNRVWGLDPHQSGVAFIAAIVPAIFCESRMFLPFLFVMTYSNCMTCSRGPFRLVRR